MIKTFAALVVLCTCASAMAHAGHPPTPVNVHESTDYSLGIVTPKTHSVENVKLSVPSSDPAGSFVTFADVYDFTVKKNELVTGTAFIPGAEDQKTFSLKGDVGELLFFKGAYVPGENLTTLTPFAEVAFDKKGESLTELLGPGKYFFAVEGITDGTKGGKYKFELTSAVSAVPEPASTAMFLAGISGLGLLARRRKISQI